MLQSITLRGTATYCHLGIEIKNLKKVNFIYGANGTGKTTISRFLADVDNPCFSSCNLQWIGGLSMKVEVYNKDFRERNFGKGSIPGVFTLGEATKEQIEAIQALEKERDDMRAQLSQRKTTLEEKKSELTALDNSFKEQVWRDVYKENEDCYKEAFKGSMGKKEVFLSKLLLELQNNNSALFTHDELVKKADTIFGEAPQILALVSSINPSVLSDLEQHPIWQKVVVGKANIAISELINRLRLNDWVNTGRKFLTEGDDTCPFCQHPTADAAFKEQLEQFFDEGYKADIAAINTQVSTYRSHADNITSQISAIESTEKANPNTKLDLETLSILLDALKSDLTANRELISSKLKEPSRVINLLSTEQHLQAISDLIIAANEEIAKHNQIVDNFSSERANLIKCIWKCLVEEHRTTIEDYQRKREGIANAINGIDKNIEKGKRLIYEKGKEIDDANENVTGVEASISEINKMLKGYGFTNFEIVTATDQPHYYQIKREDGSIADATLSEGEVTFITFLYFLQLAKGSTSKVEITNARVFVIDDPISSLDSSVLFLVSTLLKGIISDIKKGTGSVKQIILLTHNVYFHKEVSFKNGGDEWKEGEAPFYWILRKNNNVTAIQCYDAKNPVSNSYQLLWQELKNEQNTGLTKQNTMRRIIENYFKILGGLGDKDLIKGFETSQDKEICWSLICWINDGSHSIPDDLFIEQQDAVYGRYDTVFESIFREMGHHEHYRMMMGEQKAITPSEN